MPKVTKKTEGKGDAMVNTETGEETEMADGSIRPPATLRTPRTPLEYPERTARERRVTGQKDPDEREPRPQRTPRESQGEFERVGAGAQNHILQPRCRR